MTNQEKWDEIVSKIEELGDELQEIIDSNPSKNQEALELSLFGLRLSVDELWEQEIEE